VIDHVGFEVADLERSAAFYDAVFLALGGRRLHHGPQAIAYGMSEPSLWIVVRGRAAAPGYGHVALRARGRAAVAAAHRAALAHGGTDAGEPGLRPQYGSLYYAGYVRDPDGLHVEFVSGSS
jgi:catechol 2,3-dioxygenase-like lactoylglutathione lyase family enzyme